MGYLVVPQEYGYVLGVVGLSALQLAMLSYKVIQARKAAKIPYPYVYAEKSEAEKDPLKNVFNCTQRAHQNTLEIFPIFTTLALIGGIKYPVASATAGVIYVLGRAVYASNYSTGHPDKRTRGGFAILGLVTVLGTFSLTVYDLIMN